MSGASQSSATYVTCLPACVVVFMPVQSCGFDESFFPFTANCFRGCCPDGVT